jgi:K+-sensing histidine kinase KdpD
MLSAWFLIDAIADILPIREGHVVSSNNQCSTHARQFVEEGTGLAVVAAKEILDRLKGTISLKCKEEGGACFTCRLPISGKPLVNRDN